MIIFLILINWKTNNKKRIEDRIVFDFPSDTVIDSDYSCIKIKISNKRNRVGR